MRMILVAVFILAALASGADAARAPGVVITINKVSQKMTVTVGGEKKYVWLVSTGAPGYSTPSGTYTPFRMERDHFSKEWDDAPMPHSIFFTPVGHAIHGSPYTKRLGTRASHGCVRLAPANAATLYALVQKTGLRNTTVVVNGGFDFGFDFADFDPPDITVPQIEVPQIEVPQINFPQIKTTRTKTTRAKSPKAKKPPAKSSIWLKKD